MSESASAQRAARPQYVVDDSGQRTAVILPLDVYERLLEDLEEFDDVRAYDAAVEEGGEPGPWEVAREHLDRLAEGATRS